MEMQRKVSWVVAIVALVLSAVCTAQQVPAPTYSDVAYGGHPLHRLDFWQVNSGSPTPLFVWIHGGGFQLGDKANLPGPLIAACLNAGISVASINYRLSPQATYPKQMRDGARAIQFLRSNAVAWNLDPDRFAAGGMSAGAGIAQWVAFRDDMADLASQNPVAQQSTRLSCVVAIRMQSTYDPREIRHLVPGDAYDHVAIKRLFGLEDSWNWDTGQIDKTLDQFLRDASPVHHLSADDPPAFVLHYQAQNDPGNIHHPSFGEHLKKHMLNLGIDCERHMDSDFGSPADIPAAVSGFLMNCLGG